MDIKFSGKPFEGIRFQKAPCSIHVLLPTCPNHALLPAVLTCSLLTTLCLGSFFPDSDSSSLLKLKPVPDPSQSPEPCHSSCNYWNVFSELPLPSNIFHIDPKDLLCLQCRRASNGTIGGPVSCPIPITIFRYWHQSRFVCSSLTCSSVSLLQSRWRVLRMHGVSERGNIYSSLEST